jgi:hypothetical protein
MSVFYLLFLLLLLFVMRRSVLLLQEFPATDILYFTYIFLKNKKNHVLKTRYAIENDDEVTYAVYV